MPSLGTQSMRHPIPIKKEAVMKLHSVATVNIAGVLKIQEKGTAAPATVLLLTLHSHCEPFCRTVSKTVLEIVLRTILVCAHTANGIDKITQLKQASCTFGHVLWLNKDGFADSNSIVCVCNIETLNCSG